MRRQWRYALASACVIALTRTAVSQDKSPLGTPVDLVDRRACDPSPAYDVPLSQWLLNEWPASERLGRTRYLPTFQNLTCSRITYRSDGLRLVGSSTIRAPCHRVDAIRSSSTSEVHGDYGSLLRTALYSTARMVASGSLS